MSKYAYIIPVSLAVAFLLLGGAFGQSTGYPLHRQFQGAGFLLPEPISESSLSLTRRNSILIAAADEDSEDSAADKKDDDNKDGKDSKDEEDRGLKDLWDSPLLG
jgi:hypothetical protein